MKAKEIIRKNQETKFDLWQEFQTKKSDIDNMLDKISDIINIDNYLDDLKKIMNEIGNGSNISVDSVNLDTLKTCVNKLNYLKGKIEFEVIPFYNIHLLQETIKDKLEEKEQGVDEVLDNCYKLIDILNKVVYTKIIDSNTGKDIDSLKLPDLRKIYDDSIELLYKVIIYEQIYDRNELINLITTNARNMLINRYLMKYFREDLKAVRGKTDEPLRANFIDEIIDKKYSKEKEEYLDKKAKVKADLKKRIFDYQNEVDELDRNQKSYKSSVRNLKVDRRINRAKLCSYVLVPILLVGSGFGIGCALSNRIDEYRTITRVVNPSTQEIVETVSDIYDEKESTYTATVKVYSPWQKKGKYYIRDVYAYNYDPNNTNYESLNTSDNKYHYIETKEQLNANDSMEEGTVLITETIQDKTDSRKSTKYIIPFGIVGVVLAIIADLILAYKMGTYDIKVALAEIKKELDKKDSVKKVLLDDAKELYRDGSIIRNDCETSSNIYHFSNDEFSELKVIKKTWK